MKKLLGIIVLGLLWCNVSFALSQESAISKHLSGKKLERIEGIWLGEGGMIIVNYKQGSSYYSDVIYSVERSSGDNYIITNSGSSNFMSGNGKCSYVKDYTETVWTTCKFSATAVSNNIIKEVRIFPPMQISFFEDHPGATINSTFTRLWPENFKAHNAKFGNKSEKKIEMMTMINEAKATCKLLGMKEETQQFTGCALKLYAQSIEIAAKEKQTIVQSKVKTNSGTGSSGSNVMTIYDPVRDNNALIKRGQGLINGNCTLGDLSNC